MKKIRVAQWGGQHIVYLPLYIALVRGYFKQMGLAVELYHAGNDDQIYQEVVEERADFGIGDPSFVAMGSIRGDQTRVVAALVNSSSTWGYTHHPEIHPIKDLDDLVGLRVATYSRPSTSYALISNLKQRNEKRLKSMQIIEAEIGELSPLLASDKADVILEIEPMVSIAEQRGLRVVLSIGDFYPALLYTGVSSTLKTIETKPDLVEKFVQGIQLGLSTCHRETQVAVCVARELFPAVSDSNMEQAIKRMLAIRAWPEQALIHADAWQNMLKLRQYLGELKELEDPISLLEQSFAYKAITSSNFSS